MEQETKLQKANLLRQEITNLQKQSDDAAKQLLSIIQSCHHHWGETQYVPEYHEAYTIPGDPAGTMGVDWQGPVNVPAETIPKWTRQCLECGHIETTTRIKVRETKEPSW